MSPFPFQKVIERTYYTRATKFKHSFLVVQYLKQWLLGSIAFMFGFQEQIVLNYITVKNLLVTRGSMSSGTDT